jgi:hypothetical protein
MKLSFCEQSILILHQTNWNNKSVRYHIADASTCNQKIFKDIQTDLHIIHENKFVDSETKQPKVKTRRKRITSKTSMTENDLK